MLPEGQQLGHYSLARLLKSGGMGEIHLAEDSILHRQVAIKVVHTDLAYRTDADAAKEAIRLFLREAQMVARLDHIHILPLYDTGETTINGVPFMYMVMPFRQRGSLDEWLQRQHQLSIQAVANIIEQAASALQHAHDQQIIHQDVKPANFLIRDERSGYLDLQLADFGIARLATTTGESQTIRGTPSYIAPEQWEGHPVPATDQYALAVMAYELLAGSVPFQGHQYEVMHKHLHEHPQPPSVRNPHIPISIDAVLLRALAKNPSDRFLSVSAFARAFHLALYDSGDVKFTLALTPLEAQIGCRSILVLPDGRKLPIDVPAGVRHGQVIRYKGLGNRGYGDRPGALLLTIAIAKAQEMITLASASTVEKMLPARPIQHDTLPDPRRPRGSMSKTLPLITVALFVVMGSVGLFYFTRVDAENTANVNATTTAQANLTTATGIGGTVTQQAHLSSTASAQGAASATAARSASETASATTATVVAQAHMTATASATTATVVAQANLTATQAASAATASAKAAEATRTTSAASIASGRQEIDDSLQDNGQGYNWDVLNIAGGGGCAFTGGAYHTSMPQTGMMSACFAHNTDYSNFSYQAQMKLIKGDRGGIAFCANATQGNFYYFHINSSGAYGLEIYKQGNPSSTLSEGTNSAIAPGSDQTYLIAVVVNAGTIDLYVNDQPVASVTNTTFSHGQIGVVADNMTSSTEVAFNHVQVWSH